MNEWLAIMLEEIDRKKQEAKEAKIEAERRSAMQRHPEQHRERDSDTG